MSGILEHFGDKKYQVLHKCSWSPCEYITYKRWCGLPEWQKSVEIKLPMDKSWPSLHMLVIHKCLPSVYIIY